MQKNSTSYRTGMVYAMTNAVYNEVIAFRRGLVSTQPTLRPI